MRSVSKGKKKMAIFNSVRHQMIKKSVVVKRKEVTNRKPWYPVTSFFVSRLVPGASPQALTAFNTSMFSLYVQWQEIVKDKQHGIMLGYKLFLYELSKQGSKNVENRTYGLKVLEANFKGLKSFTEYRIEVLGFNYYGDGPIGAVELFTAERGKKTSIILQCKQLLFTKLINDPTMAIHVHWEIPMCIKLKEK